MGELIEGGAEIAQRETVGKTPDKTAENLQQEPVFSVIFPKTSVSKMADFLGGVVAFEVGQGERSNERVEGENEDIVDRLHRETRVSTTMPGDFLVTNLNNADIQQLERHVSDYVAGKKLSKEETNEINKLMKEIKLRLQVEQKWAHESAVQQKKDPGLDPQFNAWVKRIGKSAKKHDYYE